MPFTLGKLEATLRHKLNIESVFFEEYIFNVNNFKIPDSYTKGKKLNILEHLEIFNGKVRL